MSEPTFLAPSEDDDNEFGRDDSDADFDDVNLEDDSEFDDDDDDDDQQGNSSTAGSQRAEAVIVHAAKFLVQDPESVSVVASQARGARVSYDLSVAREDTGRVIGRRGRVANSLRQVARAAGALDEVEVSLEILDS